MSKKKQKKQQNQKMLKWLGWAALALFIGSILWSMWVDTLRPLWRSGNTGAFVNNLIGLPLTLVATGVIVYGGYRVLKSTLQVFTSEEVVANMAVIRGDEERSVRRRAQRENAMAFFKAWAAGGGIMLAGFGLMGFGGWLINL